MRILNSFIMVVGFLSLILLVGCDTDSKEQLNDRGYKDDVAIAAFAHSFESLDELIENSDNIVEAKVVSLSGGGVPEVEIDEDLDAQAGATVNFLPNIKVGISVDKVLKGSMDKKDIIVNMPVGIDDNTLYRMEDASIPPKVGGSYYFFLVKEDNGYELASVSNSIVSLDGSDKQLDSDNKWLAKDIRSLLNK